MPIVEIEFVHRAFVHEIGECSVEVENAEDVEELTTKIKNNDFKRFRILSRDYSDPSFEFSIVKPPESPDDNKLPANDIEEESNAKTA